MMPMMPTDTTLSKADDKERKVTKKKMLIRIPSFHVIHNKNDSDGIEGIEHITKVLDNMNKKICFE